MQCNILQFYEIAERQTKNWVRIINWVETWKMCVIYNFIVMKIRLVVTKENHRISRVNFITVGKLKEKLSFVLQQHHHHHPLHSTPFHSWTLTDFSCVWSVFCLPSHKLIWPSCQNSIIKFSFSQTFSGQSY